MSKNKEKETAITTPSPFGSHKSMVVGEEEDGKVVCKDDKGKYRTERWRLNNGEADPNRYGNESARINDDNSN